MRFLICGLGSIGRRHLRNLKLLGQQDVVLFRTGKSTLPDDELRGLPEEYSLQEALDHWCPDAVLVTNPTALHLDVAIPSAEAGCHLLIEKPISNSMQGINHLKSALLKGDHQALVGYQFRFHPGLKTVKRLLEDELIGRPISALAHWGEYLPDWHPWEDYRLSYSARFELGGGVLLTLSHPFDYLRWLLGEVVSVNAEISNVSNLELDVEDTAEILLTFEEGCLAHVHLDYNQRPASHWLKIIGTEGTICWDNADGATRWWSSRNRKWETTLAPKGFERNDMYLEEMRHFLEVITGGAKPICPLEEGVQALRIALASKHSAFSNGQQVHLDSWVYDEGHT